MLTFNVVYTPGTVPRLLPLTLSLLVDPGVRLRLVGNATGGAEDRAALARAGELERVSVHELAGDRPLAHGVVLNELFERFREPQFAIVDSDVVADGAFLDELWPDEAGSAAVFSATPVWVTDEEATVRPGSTFVGGRQRALGDGTPVGNTYLAIYERAALEPIWRRAPRGFDVHDRYMLDPGLQRALRKRGWRFRLFDTARLLNLGLMLEGHSIANRRAARLHHIGGFSAAGFERRNESPGWLLRRAAAILRSDQPRRLQRIADGLVHRLYLTRNRRRGWHRRMNDRRRLVSAHVELTIAALEAGAVPPEQPATGSAEVDRRLTALCAALAATYGSGNAVEREGERLA